MRIIRAYAIKTDESFSNGGQFAFFCLRAGEFHSAGSRHSAFLGQSGFNDPSLPWGAFHLVRTHLGGEGGGGGGGVKSHIHFHCVLHAKRGEGVQITCKIAYVLNGRPLALGGFTIGSGTGADPGIFMGGGGGPRFVNSGYKTGGTGGYGGPIFQKSTPISCNLRHSVTISMIFSKCNFLRNSMSKFGMLGVSPTIAWP